MDIFNYVKVVGTVTFLVWGSAEGIKAASPLNHSKLNLALILGPVGGILMQQVGYLSTPTNGYWGIAFAAFMGLISSFSAKIFADLIGDRIMASFKKESNG